MAEHAAHLTSGGPQDPDRPSIFEVLAQQSLMSTVRPAIKHGVRVFAERYPEQLGKLLQYYDEVYCLVDTIIQFHFLKTQGGSFAENFYELRRVPSFSTEKLPLPLKLRLRATACLVLIPYICQKLDGLFEALQYRYGNSVSFWSFLSKNLTLRERLLRLYLSTYPYIHSAWEVTSAGYMLSYMLRGGRWHCPTLHLSGTRLARLDPMDTLESNSQSGSDLANLSLLGRMMSALRSVFRLIATCLTTSLSVGVFFLQFLEWWYASDSRAPSLTALPTPCAPKHERLEGVQHQACPLCMQERVNSTALSVSGFVFCFSCITQHVRREGCCPITGYPASTDHLVKIYEQDL